MQANEGYNEGIWRKFWPQVWGFRQCLKQRRGWSNGERGDLDLQFCARVGELYFKFIPIPSYFPSLPAWGWVGQNFDSCITASVGWNLFKLPTTLKLIHSAQIIELKLASQVILWSAKYRHPNHKVSWTNSPMIEGQPNLLLNCLDWVGIMLRITHGFLKLTGCQDLMITKQEILCFVAQIYDWLCFIIHTFYKVIGNIILHGMRSTLPGDTDVITGGFNYQTSPFYWTSEFSTISLL